MRIARKNIRTSFSPALIGTKCVKLKIQGRGEFFNYLGEPIINSNDVLIGEGVTYIVGPSSIEILD